MCPSWDNIIRIIVKLECDCCIARGYERISIGVMIGIQESPDRDVVGGRALVEANAEIAAVEGGAVSFGIVKRIPIPRIDRNAGILGVRIR